MQKLRHGLNFALPLLVDQEKGSRIRSVVLCATLQHHQQEEESWQTIVNGWIEHRAGSAVAWYKGSIGLLDDKESATPLVKEVWWCHFISFLCCWLFAPNVSHLEESTLIIPTKYVRCLFFLRLKIVQGLKQTHDDTFDVNVIRTISQWTTASTLLKTRVPLLRKKVGVIRKSHYALWVATTTQIACSTDRLTCYCRDWRSA